MLVESEGNVPHNKQFPFEPLPDPPPEPPPVPPEVGGIDVHVVTVCWSQPDQIRRRGRVHRRHKLWVGLTGTTGAVHNVRTVGSAREACEGKMVVGPRTSALAEGGPC